MKRRWKILIVLLFVLPLIPVAWVAMLRTEGQHEVDTYRNYLIARGEKLEIAALVPPPVPPDQNGADIVNQAFGLLPYSSSDQSNLPPPMHLIAPGKAIIEFEQPDVRDDDFTNTWANVLADAAYNRPATELLRQAVNFPALDFHPDYGLGPDTPLPHLGSLRSCAERLSAGAICELRNGDAALAATNICVVLALVNGEQDEPIFGSQIFRCSLTLLAVGDNWELLQSTNLNDAELAMLQTNWERLQFLHPLEKGFSMERASAEFSIKKMRTSREYFESRFTGDSSWYLYGDWSDDFDELKGHVVRSYAALMWHVSWSYADELHMLQNDQNILEAIRTIETNGYYDPAYTNLMNQKETVQTKLASSHWNDFTGLFENSSFYSKMVGFIMSEEAAREMVVTAIALKRYQLKYGKYPSDLEPLVPEFVAAVPRDPVDGQPLRYRLNKDGTFLLYSIGSNGIDDGGVGAAPAWLNLNAPDWVWPQPATPAEVQYFYDHPPK
jgi:hypothetical protein